MILLDYLRKNNYHFIKSRSDNEYNGRNELYIFFKDEIFYILTIEKNIVYLELQYYKSEEKILIGYLVNSNEFLTEEEIIQLLEQTDFSFLKKMSDNEIYELKKNMVNARLKRPIL